MKRLIAAAFLAGTAALAVIPALPASAAASSGAAQPAMAVSPQAGTVPQAPDYSRYVNPKVTCGSFSGYVDWGGTAGVGNPAYLDASGTVRSTCNSTSYVYIGYTYGTGSYEFLFGTAGPYSHHVVSFSRSSIFFTYGHIYVDVCSNRYGWTCDKVTV